MGLEESGIGIGRGQNWKGRREVKPGLKPLVLTALLGQLPHLNTFAYERYNYDLHFRLDARYPRIRMLYSIGFANDSRGSEKCKQI